MDFHGLQSKKGNDFLIGYTQNDFYNLFRLNIFFSHSNYKNSRFSKSNIDRDIIFNSKFLLEEGNSNYNFSLSMSKYVNFLRVTFALSSNYSINKYKNIINNSILRDNRNDFWSNQLFLKTSFKGKVNFENRVFLKTNSIFSERKNVNSYTVIQNKSNLLCEITEKCLFSLDMDYTAPNKFTQENIFLDAKIIFNSNKKIIYTLIAQNITNNDMMENIFVTDYFQSKEAYSLLKRYILLSVNFRF